MRQTLLQLTARPWLTAALLFTLGLVFTAFLPMKFGAPQPVFHDEFGYILEGETFAHGRLTNDPPAGPPEFFETFHQFISPRYYAKFPPGQGLALAIGVLLGQPIIGVWIINGIWAMALYWMLRGFAPAQWAFFGAVIGIAGYGAFSYWGQTYWGGSVLALGGTLTFGGAMRLLKKRGCPIGASVLAGVGCGIMSLTRPFDGFIFSLLPAAVIVWLVFRQLRARGWPHELGRLLAFAAPAAAGVGLMLAYNVGTTGHALLFAHRLYDQTYVPRLVLFVWQKPPPASPNEPAYLKDYDAAYADNMAADPLTWPLQFLNATEYADDLRQFFFPLTTLPLVLIGLLGAFLARDRAARFALGSLAFVLVPLAIVRYYGFPHYAAAWSAPALVLMVQGARRCCAGWRGRDRRWWRLPIWVPLVLLAAWPGNALAGVLYAGGPGWMSRPYFWALDRIVFEDKLLQRYQATGRRQLVAVIYPLGHIPHDEWVFNSADPQTQPVLWARSLGLQHDLDLFAAYPGYDHWVLKTKIDGRLDKSELVVPTPHSTPAASTSSKTASPAP